MTGPDPFVPPAEAIRPAARSRPRWLLPVAILGATVLLAGLVGGAAVLLAWMAPRILETVAGPPSVGDEEDWADYPLAEDLLEGDPGSPLADSPLDCTGCFTAADAKAIQLDDALYEQLGLTEGVGVPHSLRLARVQAETIDQWRADGVAPDTCYFVWGFAPVPMTPDEIDRDDPSFIQTVVTKPDRSDPSGYYWARSSIRVFADSAGAVTHMTGLDDAIDGCHEMTWATGESTVLSAAPALDLPADVAGYTWAEDTEGVWRFYGADLQRGNLVVRLTMNSDGYGATEGEFRAYVEEFARQLSAATPTG